MVPFGLIPRTEGDVSRRRSVRIGVALLLVSAAVVGWSSAALAHQPPADGGWTCHNGNGRFDNPGDCWFHWPDAQRTWHYLGEVPDNAKAAITAGRDEIVAGHPLSAPIDADAPNHIHWDTTCYVACVVGWSYNNAQEHIIAFQIHFDSSFAFHRPASGTHGSFSNLDLQMVATHEWGHAVGLGHSATLYGHDCSGSGNVNNGWATMTQGQCLIGGHTEHKDPPRR